MTITTAQAKDFVAYARNPDTWILAARRSLAVARLLAKRYEELRASDHRDFFEFSGCFYAGYFHAGVALENALKAVLISRDPTIVQNGGLDVKRFGGRSGHALLDPVKSILGSVTDQECHLVTKLQEFAWAGRYTVPVKADALYDQDKMNIVRLSSPDETDVLASLIDRLIEHISK